MPDSDSSHPLPDDGRTEPAYEASRYALRNLETTDQLAFRWVAESKLLRGLDLLDLGCGAGRSSRFLADLGNRVTGVDANADMVREAERFASGRDPGPCYLHLPRGESLPFPDGQFRGEFSSWMILEEVVVTDHFWTDADYRSFFESAGFEVVGSHRPLGRSEDELPWLDELHTAPYVVYHLEKPQLPLPTRSP